MKMISDLPHELESEILCKVPANSLEKLKTTCKRWYSLFKDPRFVEKNNLGSEAAREVILLMNFMVYSIRINVHGIHHGVDPSVEITGKLKNIKVSKIFHCDGLILCTTKGKTRLVVWNPCNGETRWIEPRNGNRICGTYALGYGNNSYKVLMLRCYEIPSQKIHVSEFEIYDFSSDSWRVIDGLTVKFSLSSSLGVSLRKNAYWIACHIQTGLFMLTFDFTTERFGRLPLPFQSFNPQDTAALSVVREEQISVLYRSFESSSSEAKIWVSNKISEAKEVSWSDFLAVDLGGFMMEDEEAMTLDSFLLDEENKVAVCCDTDLEDEGRARIYIVGENLDIEVYKEMAKGKLCSWPFLLSYVPSLVRLKEDTARGRRKRKTRRLVK